MLAFFKANALLLSRANGDILQFLRDDSVDRQSGEILRKTAFDENVQVATARPASDKVNFTDLAFEKISSKIYSGAAAPNAGTFVLKVSDATSFPATGQIYLGRGTSNIEGPLPYLSTAQVGGYWEITLSSATTRFHNISESVILAQGGNRIITQGTVVKAPASSGSPDVTFTVDDDATMLDGENTLNSVNVTSQQIGEVGNVPRGAIRSFNAAPFPTASVTNTTPFINGRDEESDDSLRARIKLARFSRGLGVESAIKAYVQNAQAPDEAAIASSVEVVRGADKTIVFVDDNSGYERKTAGVGYEVIVDKALGGEDKFTLATGGRTTSTTKAFLLSGNSQPFAIFGNDRLAISVGGVLYEHIFASTDFRAEGSATAYEVISSINSNALVGFSAATADGGQKVTISAKEEQNEFLQIEVPSSGTDANDAILFPTNEIETLRLFKSGIPLSKDGRTAAVTSENQVDWATSISTGATLILSVDGTDPASYTFTNADFITEGTFPTVSPLNSLASWVNVFNKRVNGITAQVVGQGIEIKSNRDASDLASISIDPASSLVVDGMFTVSKGLSDVGQSSDYIFLRPTNQLKLAVPLVAGESLTANVENNEAAISTDTIVGGTVSISSDGHLWVVTDDRLAASVVIGVADSTLLTITKPSANVVRYISSSPTAFTNVAIGDYVIVSSPELNAANRLEGRVYAVTATQLDIRVTAAEYAAAVTEVNVAFGTGFAVVRTSQVPQKIKISTGTYNIYDLAILLNEQAVGFKFYAQNDELLFIQTLDSNKDTGMVLLVDFESSLDPLAFTKGLTEVTRFGSLASKQSGVAMMSLPAFLHEVIQTDEIADPPDSYIPSVESPVAITTDPNLMVGFKHPFGAELDGQPAGKQFVQMDSLSGNDIVVEESVTIRRLRSALDRFFLSYPLDFNAQDSMVVVLDKDLSNKTFSIPAYRRLTTNTTQPVSASSFNAYDTDAGPTASLVTGFTSTYSFDDFKAEMRAKRVLNPSGLDNALLFRSKQWGKGGESIKVGYFYPTFPDQELRHTAEAGADFKLNIFLKSGTAVVTSIDGTTEWNVTITANTPSAGIDQVTYTYSGTGTSPNLALLSGGEYVTINSDSGLSEENQGTFRVSTEVGFLPSATSFTVTRATGSALTESNKATLVPGSISFYQTSATTSAEIATYVTAEMYDLIDATIVDDTGTSGAGTITFSTYEDSGFTNERLQLLDGVNWIGSTALGASPQFTFKQNLAYPSDTGYAFNAGEEVRIVPTTIRQFADFINTLAVSGISTLATVEAVDHDSRLQISSQVLGSEGAVQVTGGGASTVTGLVTSAPSITGNRDLTKITIQRSAGSRLEGGNWLRLQADNFQSKLTGINALNSVRIVPNQPTTGKSYIEITDRVITNRLFGTPRTSVRTDGRSWRIENQGDLAVLTYDGLNGSSPDFSRLANLNDATPGNVNITRVFQSDEVEYFVVNGAMRFTEITIGDMVEIQNMVSPKNNGTFEVTGVSDDKKTLRVLNPEGVSGSTESKITVTNNANLTGDSFTILGFTKTQGIDWAIGGTLDITAANIATALSTIPGVSAVATLDTVLVTVASTETVTTLTYTDGGTAGATVSNTTLYGDAYASGDFSATIGLREGDTMVLTAPFAPLNRGTFRVIRVYEDSVYYENESVQEETVLTPGTAVAITPDATTEFNVVGNGNLKLSWNGVGTDPNLDLMLPGDTLTLGTDFSAANQGTFMVEESRESEAEITDIVCEPTTSIVSGSYFTLSTAADAILYYAWYNVDGAGGDPLVIGRTGIEIVVTSSLTADQHALALANAIDAVAGLTAVNSGSSVRIVTDGKAETTASADFDVVDITISQYQAGHYAYVVSQNPSAVSESNVSITGLDGPTASRPEIMFHEYEATVIGDKISISGTILDENNAGKHVVTSVLGPTRAVVSTALDAVDFIVLGTASSDLSVEEGIRYSGYKQIKYVASIQGDLDDTELVLTTREVAEKITDSGAVSITAASKLGFDDNVTIGVDGYRYDIGLLAEANRIIYGDPRDSETYSGVGAAGVAIYTDPPLVRRVTVGIVVRIRTGIPFVQVVEQVRNSVSALIKGQPIGQSIAISSIVATVDEIPGVFAVSISSPLYDVSNDVITIQQNEKAIVIDPITDITVSEN